MTIATKMKNFSNEEPENKYLFQYYEETAIKIYSYVTRRRKCLHDSSLGWFVWICVERLLWIDSSVNLVKSTLTEAQPLFEISNCPAHHHAAGSQNQISHIIIIRESDRHLSLKTVYINQLFISGRNIFPIFSTSLQALS